MELFVYLRKKLPDMKPVKELIEQPVEQLGLSDNFIHLCGKMGFEKLTEIIAITPGELIHREGFTFHWLSELITFLEKNNALHLLQGRLSTESTSG